MQNQLRFPSSLYTFQVGGIGGGHWQMPLSLRVLNYRMFFSLADSVRSQQI